MGKLNAFFQLSKPKVSLAFYFLYFLSFLASSSLYFKENSLYLFTLGSLALFASISGSNIINNYYDRDIDSLMFRTKKRPLPLGLVSPSQALSSGLLLLGFSFILSFFLGSFSFLLLIIGTSFYLLLYTVYFKRKSFLNVLLTIPSVASPVWFGWFIGSGNLGLEGFLTGLTVSFWGVTHLWSLSLVYSRDYERADVPMLTATVSRKKAVWHVLISSLSLILYTFSLYLLGFYGSVFLSGIVVPNFLLFFLNLKALKNNPTRYSWWIYKFSTFYILEFLLSTVFDRSFPVSLQTLMTCSAVNLLISLMPLFFIFRSAKKALFFFHEVV